MTADERLDVLDLAAYTRSMAVMMNSGVSLIRQLSIIEEMFGEPLRSVTRLLFNEVDAGNTLSAAMAKRPDVFTRIFVQMVKVGEVGGVLDETFLQLADLLEKDWIDGAADQEYRGLLVPRTGEEASFSEAPPDDRLRTLSLYFRCLGTMVTAGVPLAEGPANAFDTAAEILPPGPERTALSAIAGKVREAGRLRIEYLQLPFVPGIALQLASIGIETGTFALMCEKIAQLLEYQRRYYLLKQGR